MQHAGRNLPQTYGTLRRGDGVACVGAAVEARHYVIATGNMVDDSRLTLVAILETHEHVGIANLR